MIFPDEKIRHRTFFNYKQDIRFGEDFKQSNITIV